MSGAERIRDVAIVGAGVSGANIARCLSAYELDVALLEKEEDVSFGVSKANSGIVHGGFHHDAKYLKARLEIRGAAMFDRLAEELDFPFERCGIIVVALHEDEMSAIGQLYERGRKNGVPGIEMCSRERMLELEPKLSRETVGGLYAPRGGIVEPYRFVFSLVESAIRNGVELLTKWRLERAERQGDAWRLHAADGRSLLARRVVNAAGLRADEVSRLFGGEVFAIKGRKGQYWLLDRLTLAKPGRVVFPVPTPVSKGMLIIPTVEGTVLIGPTATEVEDKDDASTTGEELGNILRSARNLIPTLAESDVITTFAGIRPVLGEDFLIAPSALAPGLFQVAGIQSPGLTASPAIGEYVTGLLEKDGLPLAPKKDWNPRVEKLPRARDLAPEMLDGLVRSDPAWGSIVCRCERVTEAEVVAAIAAGHTTLDGIKYRTRAQMGRCQGGFCTSRLLHIIMRETGMGPLDITKRGGDTKIIGGEL
jgi:glycerol-3-phosphate dehydrogenase